MTLLRAQRFAGRALQGSAEAMQGNVEPLLESPPPLRGRAIAFGFVGGSQYFVTPAKAGVMHFTYDAPPLEYVLDRPAKAGAL